MPGFCCLSDSDAYMQLVLCNTQSELHPLEEGIHALNSGMNGSEYARQIGKPQTTIADKIKAARVYSVNARALDCIRDSWRNLAEIHAAPKWLWGGIGRFYSPSYSSAAPNRTTTRFLARLTYHPSRI